MILFPKVGASYWYVTDFYETFVAIPVTVTERSGLFEYSDNTPALFRVRHELAEPGTQYHEDGYTEIYDASRFELYRTEEQARLVADRLNREAGRK